MRNSYHGGSCCGMRHLFSFDGQSDAQLDRDISQIERDEFGMTNRLRVIEVVLTDRQLRQNPWASRLRARGFFPVSRFHNSNSGNDCTVFHRHPDGDTRLNLDQVPGWDTPYEAPPPPPPAVGYFYIKQSRRRNEACGDAAMYSTLQAARDRIAYLQRTYHVPYTILGSNTARVVEEVPFVNVQAAPVVDVAALPAEPRRALRVGDRVRRIDVGGGCGFMPVGGEMVVTVGPDHYNMVEGYYEGRNVHLLQRRFELIEDEPEVTVVRTRFHNVYNRNGRATTGWTDLETANRYATPYRTGVDRHQIFSDGTETWERLDNA